MRYIGYGNFSKNKIAGHLDNPRNMKIWRVWNLYKDYDDKLYYGYPNYYGNITIENNTITYATYPTILGEGRDVWVGPNNRIYYSSGSSGTGIQYYLDENNAWKQTSWRARTLSGTVYTIDNSYHEGAYPMLQGDLIWKTATGSYYTIMSYRQKSTVKTGFFYLGANQFWYESYQTTSTGHTSQWEVFYVGNNTYKRNYKWTYDSDLGRNTWQSYQWKKNVNGTVSNINISYPWKINDKLYTVKGDYGLVWKANSSIAFYRLNESTLQWEFIRNITLPTDFPGQDDAWWLHTFVYDNVLYYTSEDGYFIQIPIGND